MIAISDEIQKNWSTYTETMQQTLFLNAAQEGLLEIVDMALTSPDSKNISLHMEDDKCFRYACRFGHLDIVKYLLTSRNLTEHADIHADGDYSFEWACRNGHLEVVRYLLTSPDLKEHANIYADDCLGFIWACEQGQLEVVQYLLTSSELTKHADIHASDDSGFRLASANANLDVIKYLLSFNGGNNIDFQKTDYNLEWAIENQYDEIIIVMMRNLKSNNPLEYLEYLPKIEIYNKELYEKVKNIEIESLEINHPPETSLYL